MVPDNEVIVPAWINADMIQTPKEVFDSVKVKGYAVHYVRIPISPEQRPEDKYLDEYVQILHTANIRDSVIFNCGMGVGRCNISTLNGMY